MQRWNQYLLNLTQKSLGINNYYSEKVSGESFWINHILKSYNLKIVFDIGAHVGDYTTLLRENDYNGTVYLFEPHPNTYTNLIKKIKPDNKTHIFNIGLSETDKSTLIFDYDEDGDNLFSPHASLYSNVITDLHGSEKTSYHNIKLTTLDIFTQKYKIDRISLLKIDTEGHEYSILKGATRLLEEDKIDLIQFEFGEMNVISRCYFKDFYDLLKGKYRLFRLLPTGLLPIENYNARFYEIFIYQNIVGIHHNLLKGKTTT